MGTSFRELHARIVDVHNSWGASNADRVMLKFVVQASPDEATRTAMVSLYKDILSGNSSSSQARRAIDTIEMMNSCAR
jgi:hypothetical protein